MLARDFKPGFRIALHDKDMGIVTAAARDTGVVIPLGAAVAQLIASLKATGDGSLDHSALLKLVSQLSGQPEQHSFNYRDERGSEKEARAKLFLTESIQAAANNRFPLYFSAGYELPDGSESAYVKEGWVVVSPRELSTNPLIRNVNPDVALLHITRSLPFVNDAA